MENESGMWWGRRKVACWGISLPFPSGWPLLAPCLVLHCRSLAFLDPYEVSWWFNCGMLWHGGFFRLICAGSGQEYLVVYDTLLFGHENWIYGAHWAPPVIEGTFSSSLTLFSITEGFFFPQGIKRFNHCGFFRRPWIKLWSYGNRRTWPVAFGPILWVQWKIFSTFSSTMRL